MRHKNLLRVALPAGDARCTVRTAALLGQHCYRSRRFFEAHTHDTLLAAALTARANRLYSARIRLTPPLFFAP